MEERPMMLCIDAVDWHSVVSGAPKATLEQITPGTVKAVRDMANDVCLDILYYTRYGPTAHGHAAHSVSRAL